MFTTEAKNVFGVRSITSDSMASAISTWMNTYRGTPEWVDKKDNIKTIKFAKSVASETARLTTLALEVNFDGARAKYMDKWNRQSVMPKLRNWLEYGCAAGTVILKPNGKGVDFVTPDRFQIVDKDGNGSITGVIFQDRYTDDDLYYTKLEYHRFFTADVRMGGGTTSKETTYYMISNRVYKSKNESEIGKPCDLAETKWSNLLQDVSIVKNNDEKLNSMLFGVFRTPPANDIDLDSPLGISIFSDAMEELKDLDIAYSRYVQEIFDSQSIELLDDRLLNMTGKKVNSSNNIKLPHHVVNVFGSDEKEFYQAIDRPLKTDERLKGINNQLSFIGYKCGFSNGYFVFNGETGQIQTATEVESTDRRTIQLIKDMRDSIETCLNDLYYAQSVFADLYNLAPVGEYETSYNFGDITYNYEEDKTKCWGYVVQGKYPLLMYYVRFEGMSEKEAKEVVEMAKEENKSQGIFE